MKYYLKKDLSYIIFILLISINTALIISFGYRARFTFKEALKFITLLGSPCYILLILFYSTTYLSIDDNSVTVNYFGWIKKPIPNREIESIERVKNTSGLLSLSEDKLLITYEKREILVSLKRNNEFLGVMKNKIEQQNNA